MTKNLGSWSFLHIEVIEQPTYNSTQDTNYYQYQPMGWCLIILFKYNPHTDSHEPTKSLEQEQGSYHIDPTDD